MKNIKGISRKVKFKVQSVRELPFSYDGFQLYVKATITLERKAGEVASYINNLVRKEKLMDLDGMKPYLVAVRIPVINLNRNKVRKTNNWRDITIASLAVDEVEAYNLAKREIQWRWQKAFKLDRYRRR